MTGHKLTPEEMPTFTCQYCGKTKVCARRWHGQFDRKQQFCNTTCSNRNRMGEAKGFIDKHGYRAFNINRKQVYEHRLVMESIIGRELSKKETVHHKNGNRLDNRPENLELWASRHGRGHRVEDQVSDAVELLKTYREFVTDEQKDDLEDVARYRELRTPQEIVGNAAPLLEPSTLCKE